MRQQYNTNPWEKKFEVFQNFSSGLNTVTAQDNMKDDELTDALNFRIAERGSLQPRHGCVEHIWSGSGVGQGYFRFYEGSTYKEIEAISGFFYLDGEYSIISGLPQGFQPNEPIEGVQFKEKMYFATGTRLIEFNGTEFSVVEPYRPKPLEALYIGSNGLADDPYNFMQDGEAAFPRIDGVTFDQRYGIVNEPFRLTSYVSRPAGMVLEYKIEKRMATDTIGTWNLVADWDTSHKTFALESNVEGSMEIRVQIRDQADPTYDVEEADENGDPITVAYDNVVGEYWIPKYKIKPTVDPDDEEPDTDAIHECRNILLHWNRLVIYGESKNKDMIYMSHLDQTDYFPIPNTLRFENPRNEKLTALVPFRGMLVAFTPTTVQALYGSSPYDFKRVMLNTGIGCIAPNTARVMKNYIAFLSYEGVHILKTIGYAEDKANVEKLDYLVDNEIPLDEEACAWFHDGEYHIVFPNHDKRMRYHYELQSWMKDESPVFTFHKVWDFDGELFGQQRYSAKTVRFDPSVHTDDGNLYDMYIETKFYSFQQPYHTKKLKELQLLFSAIDEAIDIECYVYSDEAATVRPDTSYATITKQGNVKWNTKFEPNIHLSGETEMGEWEVGDSRFGAIEYDRKILKISGRCLKTKIRLVHKHGKNFKIIGFAYIFKTKRP